MQMVSPSPELTDNFLARIGLRSARVAIVGLGYVGLPLAETFAAGGFALTGFDIDSQKVAKLRLGQSYIGHISGDRVSEMLRSGRFEPTDDPRSFESA